MSGSVIKRHRTRVALQKRASSEYRAKTPTATSAAVLVLSGSTVLRRRKSAEMLAETLKVDLLRVDVSAVVSQYIGETEKNLNGVFDTAEVSGAIIFFDEVDVLFGACSTVRDSNDRCTHAETTHLLQRIESHNGIVILSTNGMHAIEQAFSPRTQVVVMVGRAGTGRKMKQ